MLISCIMPTRARSEMAHAAIEHFVLQSWPERELVILDDLDDRSFIVPPMPYPNVHYHIVERRLSLGEKRNLAIERASGEIICHWDDDDWGSPGRLEDQAERLLSTGAMVTGYNAMTFIEGDTRWMFHGEPNYALGTSLMYRREFWKRHPFAKIDQGEDTIFLGHAQREGVIVSAPANGMMYATIHGGNTITKSAGQGWERTAA